MDYNIDNSVKEIIKINQEDLFNGKLNIILDSKKIELFISYGCSKIPNKVLDKIVVINGTYMEVYLLGIEEQ